MVLQEKPKKNPAAWKSLSGAKKLNLFFPCFIDWRLCFSLTPRNVFVVSVWGAGNLSCLPFLPFNPPLVIAFGDGEGSLSPGHGNACLAS